MVDFKPCILVKQCLPIYREWGEWVLLPSKPIALFMLILLKIFCLDFLVYCQFDYIFKPLMIMQ